MKKILILLFVCLNLIGCNLQKSEYELLREEIRKDAYNCAVETGYNLSYSKWLDELNSGTILIDSNINDMNGTFTWKRVDSEEWIAMDSLVVIIGEKYETIRKVVTEYFAENHEYYELDALDFGGWLMDTISGGHKYDPIKSNMFTRK